MVNLVCSFLIFIFFLLIPIPNLGYEDTLTRGDEGSEMGGFLPSVDLAFSTGSIKISTGFNSLLFLIQLCCREASFVFYILRLNYEMLGIKWKWTIRLN